MIPTGISTVIGEVGVGALAVGESVNFCVGGRVDASTGVTIVVGCTTGVTAGDPVAVCVSIGLVKGVPVAGCVGGNPDGSLI